MLRVPGRRPAGPPRRRPPLQPEQGPHRPVRPRHDLDAVGSGRRLRPGRQPRQVAAQRRHRHDRLRLGGRPAAPKVDAGHGHLRDARARLHQVADLGRDEPRDLPRGHRQDPLPPEAGRHRRRAAAGLRVRRGRDQRDEPADRAAAHQLLGLQPDQLLQPARGLLRRARRGLPRPRVPGHGQGLPQGRHRGHPRRRLQPHRRRQPRGPDDQLPGPRQPDLLPPRALRQAVLHEPVGLREHVQLQRPAGREVHRRVPAVLGPRDARRRLPLRPRLDPVARSGRQPDGRSAGPLAHRARQRAVRHQDHRRGLGRRRALPGRLLPGLPLGRVERPLPRRHPELRQGRQGPGLRRSRRGSPAAPTSTRPTASCRSTASTSSPPTTASRSTTWSRTTASTTRPTARTTTTGPTTT